MQRSIIDFDKGFFSRIKHPKSSLTNPFAYEFFDKENNEKILVSVPDGK